MRSLCVKNMFEAESVKKCLLSDMTDTVIRPVQVKWLFLPSKAFFYFSCAVFLRLLQLLFIDKRNQGPASSLLLDSDIH